MSFLYFLSLYKCMRLFIAVEVPEEVKKRMGELEKELPDEGLRKVDPGLMHITLKFLGEVEEVQLEEIKKALGKIEFLPFKVRVKGVGVFPKEDYVKVVWAGTGGEGLEGLAEKVELALASMFPKEARGFSGHLTLARVKRKIGIKEFLGKHRGEEFGEFGVRKFLLMQSVLGRGGPEYSVVEEFPAGG
ncbi:RNA 2',3'-cyclic phosphodiesterase [Candidatus Micrarchaeota archaeon]|nr:RNA 2',3'-cyclic phosphodiesterase [Candidatus Micrarchaeota archaeon]MBD3417444.1 RNA 2',3'-cyclic phosphodiesterase [Candidatus Micrarchaeota archaeon]